MANNAQFGNVGTMRIRTYELRPSATTGNVKVVDPYTRNTVIDDTVANVITYFNNRINNGVFPFLTTGLVLQYLQRGQELRGVNLGVSSTAISSTEPVSANISIPGR